MSIKIRKGYDDVMAERLSVGIEEWRKKNGEPLRNGSPFTIHHSLFPRVIYQAHHGSSASPL
jgi:hypothetical protein